MYGLRITFHKHFKGENKMIAICICILCAILIFTTWRLEHTLKRVRRLEDDLYITQVELHNLRNDVFELKYKGDKENG